MIPGVILAAGASSRMGRPKALMPTGVPGQTFLSRLVETLRAGGVADVSVVVGVDSTQIRAAAAAERQPPRLIENPTPEQGQSSSILAALRAVDHPGVRAMLVALVDIPLVSPSTVRALLDTYHDTRAVIIRPSAGGRHGHPVIFDRSLFDELRGIDPSVGAKAVIKAHLASVVDVPVEDGGAFADIDTRADYERIVGPWPEG